MRRPPASLFADLLGCRDPLALVSAPFRPAAGGGAIASTCKLARTEAGKKKNPRRPDLWDGRTEVEGSALESGG